VGPFLVNNEVLTLLLGPLGLTAGLLFLVWLFVTERIVPSGRLADQKEATKEALDIARQANQSLDRMADAVETRNTLDAERVRLEAARVTASGERRQP
jgi:hypothetical protein